MEVFKFGGASVKDAASIRNLADILKRHDSTNLVVVISAIGKTTNALERLVNAYVKNNPEKRILLEQIIEEHNKIAEELCDTESCKNDLERLKRELQTKLEKSVSLNYHFEYDQIVSFGEILSTTIISHFLNEQGIKNDWVDIREYLKTDNLYREANLDWKLSERLVRNRFTFDGNSKLYVTQGFIASTINNLTTTLGREGSDFSAAILAYFLWASSVTVWKDVPGVLNADPKGFSKTVKLDKLSYRDAIELAYYGTSVIHPKTIQPLQNRQIPLYVKSFLKPEVEGTLITSEEFDQKVACYIVKPAQVLLSISALDFAFIAENHLQDIFSVFAATQLKINLMQNSAVSFNACVANDNIKLSKTIQGLEKLFTVSVKKELELITIRYYNEEAIQSILGGRKPLLTQKTSTTIQMVV